MPTSLAPPTPERPAAVASPAATRLGLAWSDGDRLLAELADTPLTIGGGPKCTVRLDAAGLRPLHCVVTPTAEGPIARRWAPATKLNGVDFTEAALAAGDLLRIGTVDLAVIALPSADDSQPAPEPQAADPPPAVSDVPTDALNDLFEAEAEAAVVAQPEPEPPAPESATADEGDDEQDPAIPRRLLQPWSPAALGQRSSLSDEDDADDFVAATSPESDLWSFTDEPTAAVVAADEQETDLFDAESAEPEAAEPDDSMADAWTGSLVAAPTLEPEVIEPPAATPTVRDETARLRLDACRVRVRRLVAALRESRESLAGADRELADRDESVRQTQSRLEEALAAADAAEARLSELDSVAEHAGRLEEELAAATERITELEEQLAAAEAADESRRESDAEPAEVAAGEPVAGVDSAEESDEAVHTEVESEPVAVAAADSPWGTEPEAEPAPAAEAEPAEAERAPEEFSRPVDASDDSDDLWGIERLAVEEAADSGPATLWGQPIEPVADEVASSEADEAPVELEPVDESTDSPEPAVADPEPEVESEHNAGREEAVEDVVATDEVDRPSDEPMADEDVEEAPAPLAAFQPRAEAPRGEAPASTSFIEQYAHLLPEDDEPAEPPAPIEPVADTAPAEAGETPSDDDDSIDDYMRRMMERIRGDAAPATPAPPPVAPPSDHETPEAASPAGDPLEPVDPLKCLSEMKRSPKREVTTDLGAMRQLANQSARHAIDVAATRQSRERAWLWMTVSAVSVACGALAATTASDVLSLQFTAGLTAVVVGGWFACRTVRACEMVKEPKAPRGVAIAGE